VLPAGVDSYVDNTLFTSGTPLGGYFNWEGPNNYSYAGVAIEAPSVEENLLVKLDKMLDDGNLNSGIFRKTPNSRYTYILWES